MRALLFLIGCLTLSSLRVDAQVTESFLRQQLVDRNIDEADFRQRLKDRGVNYDSLEEVPASRYDEVEKIVQEILAEMEGGAQAEGAEPLLETVADPVDIVPEAQQEAVEDVKESVLEGATIEEAVAEELQEQEPAAPPATIYGHGIFRNKTLKVFRQADNIKPREAYRLGTGDEVTISIWGISIFERTYTINESGYIRPDEMPRIFLRDLTLRDAREKLRSTFSRFYRFNQDQFEISLRYARTLSIGIYGEVFTPGNHTISSINSAFNALVAAGGPTDIGTVRNIKWIKNDGEMETIDVYAYMADPAIAKDFYLADNDIIQVPLAERVVGISGAVNRPMRYELTKGEELMDLIDYAGGFRPDAYQAIIQLRRYQNDEQKVIDIDFAQLKEVGGDYILKNGDIISVRTIPALLRDFVEISGSVELPGQYEFKQGMRISDLLFRGKLVEESQRDFAVLRRNNRDGTYNFERINLLDVLQNSSSPSNVLLSPGDQLSIYARARFVDAFNFSVSGQVRSPGSFEYDPSQNLKVRDAVMLAGGLTPSATAFGYLIRKDLKTQEPEYLSLPIQQIVSDPGNAQNIAIRPGDELRIQSEASFYDEAVVRIDGAIRSPGSFAFDETMTLRDLILLANGLKLEAATNRVQVSRLLIEQNEPTRSVVATLQIDENLMPTDDPDFALQPYDQVFVRTVPEFEFQKTVVIDGEVRFPGPYILISENEPISSIVQRAGGLTAEAFPEGATLSRSEGPIPGPIVIRLDEAIKQNNSPSNIVMKRGDRINVPKVRDFVSIAGAVNTSERFSPELVGPDNRVTVIFDGSRSARHYIERFAGGFAENGDRKNVTVEYANGEIRKSKDFGLFQVYPPIEKGSMVHVGTKPPKPPDRPEGEKEKIDWGEVLKDAVTQATAVLTLILLIDRTSN